MARFEIVMHRKSTAYRMMTIEAASPAAARRLALALVRAENGDGDAEPREDDEVGEWCDDSYGRAVIERVGLKAPPKVLE